MLAADYPFLDLFWTMLIFFLWILWIWLLFTIFALHHSMMARTGAKAWLTRQVPPELERSLYVWISSVLFLGDRMTPTLIVGGLLAISGVAITQVRPSARSILTPEVASWQPSGFAP